MRATLLHTCAVAGPQLWRAQHRDTQEGSPQKPPEPLGGSKQPRGKAWSKGLQARSGMHVPRQLPQFVTARSPENTTVSLASRLTTYTEGRSDGGRLCPLQGEAASAHLAGKPRTERARGAGAKQWGTNLPFLERGVATYLRIHDKSGRLSQAVRSCHHWAGARPWALSLDACPTLMVPALCLQNCNLKLKSGCQRFPVWLTSGGARLADCDVRGSRVNLS